MSEEIETSVAVVLKEAPATFAITSTAEADRIGAYREKIRAARKTVTEFFAPLKKSLNDAKDALMSRIHQCEDPLISAQDACDKSLSAWVQQERERVEAEQRRLDEEAKKQAAKEALAAGDKAEAKAIQQGKIAVVSSAVARPVAKVSGVSTVDRWDAELTDLQALIKAAAAGKVPLSYVTWDEKVVKGVVRASKGAATIPGVTARKIVGFAGR